MSFRYVVIFLLASVLCAGAHQLRVPPHWIAIGAVALTDFCILTGIAPVSIK
jgi:hypothetical protein